MSICIIVCKKFIENEIINFSICNQISWSDVHVFKSNSPNISSSKFKITDFINDTRFFSMKKKYLFKNDLIVGPPVKSLLKNLDYKMSFGKKLYDFKILGKVGFSHKRYFYYDSNSISSVMIQHAVSMNFNVIHILGLEYDYGCIMQKKNNTIPEPHIYPLVKSLSMFNKNKIKPSTEIFLHDKTIL